MKLKEMTVEELKKEWHYWNDKIKNATSWGAALGAADEFRRDTERELHRRGEPWPPAEGLHSDI